MRNRGTRSCFKSEGAYYEYNIISIHEDLLRICQTIGAQGVSFEKPSGFHAMLPGAFVDSISASLHGSASSPPSTNWRTLIIHSSLYFLAFYSHLDHPLFIFQSNILGASQVTLVIKNPSSNSGDTRDKGSIPGSGRYPGGGNANPLKCVLAWRIPWTEKPGRLQSIGSQTARHE